MKNGAFMKVGTSKIILHLEILACAENRKSFTIEEGNFPLGV